MRNKQQATTLGKQTNLINKKWKVFFAALAVMYAGNVLADDPLDMDHNEDKLYKNLASDSGNEHETVSIDGKEVQIATDFVQLTCGDSNLKALQKDIEGLSFKTKDRGMFWNGYSYQCWSLALDLTDNEMNAIPKYIREEAQKEKGISSDSEHWKTIAQIIKKRILVYDYQGKIGGFYEYGKEYSKNGTKRVYAESGFFGGGVWTCHYKELIAEVKQNDKIPEKQPLEQLFKAIKNGNLSDISNAINNGADVNAINDNLIDTTPLCEASRSGNLEVVKSLIKHSAKVNLADKMGITPLMIATQFGHKNIVKYLVEQGANINEQTHKEGSSLQIAKKMLKLSFKLKQHKEIIDVLKSKGIKNLENLNNPEQYEEIVKYLEKQQKSYIFKNKDQKQPQEQLFEAIKNGNLSDISNAIKNGADVNEIKDSTPLCEASRLGNLKIIKYLISRGANVNLSSENGFTPLMIATEEGHLECVKYLVEHGADISKRSHTHIDINDPDMSRINNTLSMLSEKTRDSAVSGLLFFLNEVMSQKNRILTPIEVAEYMSPHNSKYEQIFKYFSIQMEPHYQK